MSDTFIWQAPPEHSQKPAEDKKWGVQVRRQLVNENLARLQARPGTWAIVFDGSSSPNGGEVYKVLGCEVTARVTFIRDKRTLDIYARWPSTNAKAA